MLLLVSLLWAACAPQVAKPAAHEAAVVPTSLAAGACSPLVETRNAGTNPSSYTAGAPIRGTSFIATVDLTTTGHTNAQLFGFDTAVEMPLCGGQMLLCSDGGSGELTRAPIVHGPIAKIAVPIPNDLRLCGLTVHTQVMHFSGVFPFALSNAQDLRLGVR